MKNNNTFFTISEKIIKFILIVSIAVTLIQYSLIDPVIQSAIVLSSTKQPESFTELYFNNHTQLPFAINESKQYHFTFTIHNVEHQDMFYPYIVYLEAAGQRIVLDQKTIRVNKNKSISINENFGPLVPTKMKITVELVNKHQPISFWMDKS